MLVDLVDLVHAFNGVAVGQFKKRLEKLFSVSTLLWRLLKLLSKILHMCIISEGVKTKPLFQNLKEILLASTYESDRS